MYFVYTNNPENSITSPIQKVVRFKGEDEACTDVYERVFRVVQIILYWVSLALFQLGPFTTTNTLKFNFHFPNFLNI